VFPPDEDDEEDIIPSVDIPGEDDEPSAADAPDPADSVPSVDVPDAESKIPSVEIPDTDDVPADLQQAFWTLVAVVDAAILAAGLGVLFLVFRGETALAGGLFVAAAGLLFYARERYRSVSAREFTESDDTGDGTPPESADAESEPKDA